MDMVVWEACIEVVQIGERFPPSKRFPLSFYLDKCFCILSLTTNQFLNVLFCV